MFNVPFAARGGSAANPHPAVVPAAHHADAALVAPAPADAAVAPLQVDGSHGSGSEMTVASTSHSDAFRISPQDALPITPKQPKSHDYSPQANERVYQDVMKRLTSLHDGFDKTAEADYMGSTGIVKGVNDISNDELVRVMMHTRDNPELMAASYKKYAKGPDQTKFYLMSNKKQDWNLRLHVYGTQGNILGNADTPHYHRWPLASRILTGGYINVRYKEAPADTATNNKNRYDAYEMKKSASTTQKNEQDGLREIEHIGQTRLDPVAIESYHEGAAHYFPVEAAHSVQSYPAHYGTGRTLAHTGPQLKDKSIAFQKTKRGANVEGRFAEHKASSKEEFSKAIDQEIAALQVLTLKDELQALLQSKLKHGDSLTLHEQQHLKDGTEFNYTETSLLSALAIFKMEKASGVPHREFSKEAADLIDAKLRLIDADALDAVIQSNQNDLLNNRLTTHQTMGMLVGQLPF